MDKLRELLANNKGRKGFGNFGGRGHNTPTTVFTIDIEYGNGPYLMQQFFLLNFLKLF